MQFYTWDRQTKAYAPAPSGEIEQGDTVDIPGMGSAVVLGFEGEELRVLSGGAIFVVHPAVVRAVFKGSQ